VPSAVTWEHDNAEVSVVQETGYPESDITMLTVNPTRSASFSLNVRVPAWCNSAKVSVNGTRNDVTCEPGKWATIRRQWSAGDRVKVQLPMHLNLSAIDRQHARRVAITYGPVVLVRLHEPDLTPAGGALADWLNAGRRPLEFRAVNQPTSSFVPPIESSNEAQPSCPGVSSCRLIAFIAFRPPVHRNEQVPRFDR
jgi:hypothetical protein